jgi:very-short-patch-repair endonuclease
MRGKSRTGLEEAIALLAERQFGKVSRQQLLGLGLGAKAIDYRVSRGWLRPDFAGVYSLGHRPESRESRWMAAVLAGGRDAVLSHWSAATLHAMRSGTGPRSHVTTPRRRRGLANVTFHYARLKLDEMTDINRIPVTTPGRTLIDLAPQTRPHVLSRMLAASEDCWVGPPLEALIDRYPRRAGTPKLRAVAEQARSRSRSDLEAEFLEWLDEAEFPRPQHNATIVLTDSQFECDFVWDKEGVIVELDTYATHGDREAFTRDRERDRKLQAAGWRIGRVTEMSDPVKRDLRRLLGASAAGSPSRRAAA